MTPEELFAGCASSARARAELNSRLQVPERTREFATWGKCKARPEVLKAAKAFVDRLGRAPGLLLIGPIGTFKTSLIWTIILSLRERFLAHVDEVVARLLKESEVAWHKAKQEIPE